MSLYVETENLKKQADAMLDIAAEMRTNFTAIENLVLALGTQWQGKAELEYTAKILFVKKQFEALYNFLVDYAQVVHAAVEEYEEVEKIIITKMEV